MRKLMRKKGTRSTQSRPHCLISTWQITCTYMQPPCAKKAFAVLNYGHTAQLAHDRSHVYDKKLIIIIKNNF